MLRDELPVHREEYLDKARSPRGGRQVADVGLDGTHEEGPGRFTLPAVNRRRRVYLGRVAEPRPGPVRFEVVHL